MHLAWVPLGPQSCNHAGRHPAGSRRPDVSGKTVMILREAARRTNIRLVARKFALARSLRRIADPHSVHPYGAYGNDTRIGSGPENASAGTGIIRPAPAVRTKRTAISRTEYHVDPGGDDGVHQLMKLVERTIGIVALRVLTPQVERRPGVHQNPWTRIFARREPIFDVGKGEFEC